MSDEPKRRRRLHPTVRLILGMLGCDWVAWVFAPAVGDFQDFWLYAAPYPQIAEGAAFGLTFELATRVYLRVLDSVGPKYLNH
jgi:hypothetical protein